MLHWHLILARSGEIQLCKAHTPDNFWLWRTYLSLIYSLAACTCPEGGICASHDLMRGQINVLLIGISMLAWQLALWLAASVLLLAACGALPRPSLWASCIIPLAQLAPYQDAPIFRGAMGTICITGSFRWWHQNFVTPSPKDQIDCYVVLKSFFFKVGLLLVF